MAQMHEPELSHPLVATSSDELEEREEEHKKNVMSVHIDPAKAGKFSKPQSPLAAGTHHLSSSLATGSIDRNTPWLVPISQKSGDETQDPPVNSQNQGVGTHSRDPAIETPKIIDIMIND